MLTSKVMSLYCFSFFNEMGFSVQIQIVECCKAISHWNNCSRDGFFVVLPL